MAIGVFAEKGCPPTEPQIRGALGSTIELWDELNRWLSETLRARQEWKYMYGRKYGWARRFQLRGSLLCALYPAQNGFIAQVVLSRALLEQASLLKLSNNSKRAIHRARPYPEGKWLFIAVESERDAADVKKLLTLKAGGATKGRTERASVSAVHM